MILAQIRNQLESRKSMLLADLAATVGLNSEQVQLALAPLAARGRLRIEQAETSGCAKGCGGCASACAPDLRRVIWIGKS
ncbi:FeoC-like transcriptional regulator [Burkholderiaceae bacterium DAT-1]|nr:FeoC-like transcriptional regulator [Burkholderiaceae bacterium DAT-1]